MKKIFLILATTALIASCGVKTPETSTGETATGNTTEVTSTGTVPTLTADEVIEDPAAELGSEVEMYYILRDNDENGEILDTNVLTDGTPSQTLKAILGQGGLIPGFEKSLYGMKKGEVKSFTVSAEEGYGTGTVVTELDVAELAPEFTRTVPVESMASVATQTAALANMNPEDLKLLEGKNPGDTVVEDENIKIILISRNDTEATLEFHNLASPFYPKEITAGLKATMEDGSELEILSVEDWMATFRVITSQNPFTKETYKVGSTAKYAIPTATGQAREIDVKILEIHPTTVKVEVPNTHALANKTLYFTVKVTKVTPAITETTTSTETLAQ